MVVGTTQRVLDHRDYEEFLDQQVGQLTAAIRKNLPKESTEQGFAIFDAADSSPNDTVERCARFAYERYIVAGDTDGRGYGEDMFAEEVDYYGSSLRGRSDVIADIVAYERNWDAEREYFVTGRPVIRRIPHKGGFSQVEIEAQIAFYTKRSDGKTRTGSTVTVARFQFGAKTGTPYIVFVENRAGRVGLLDREWKRIRDEFNRLKSPDLGYLIAEDVVSLYIHGGNNGSDFDQSELFAEEIEFYDDGLMPRSKARQLIAEVVEEWPVCEFEILRVPKHIGSGNDDQTWEVKTRYAFHFDNKRGLSTEGERATVFTVRVRPGNDRPAILAIRTE